MCVCVCGPLEDSGICPVFVDTVEVRLWVLLYNYFIGERQGFRKEITYVSALVGMRVFFLIKENATSSVTTAHSLLFSFFDRFRLWRCLSLAII